MASWMDMMADNRIADNAEVTAPNGEKVTMGQVREAWLSRQAQLDRKEKDIKQAQGELASVFSMLQGEKVSLEAAREEIKNRQEEIERLRSEGERGDEGSSRLAEKFQLELNGLKEDLKKVHATNVEMADIYLDDVWERSYAKHKDDLPDGITRNDVLKYAMQNSIKDRRGIVDIEGAISRIIEPKRQEKLIKEAEERGAKKREQEMLVRSVGSPSAFQTRDPGSLTDGKKFTSLDSAFEAAAKDASVFFPDQVQ